MVIGRKYFSQFFFWGGGRKGGGSTPPAAPLLPLPISYTCAFSRWIYFPFRDCRTALVDSGKIYDGLRTDLDATFPLVTKSVTASLVESEAISQSVEGKCWQTTRKKVDDCSKKMNSEHKSQMQKIQKELQQKSKVKLEHWRR